MGIENLKSATFNLQKTLTGETTSTAGAKPQDGLYEVASTNTSDQVNLTNNLKKAADGKIDTLEELNDLLTKSSSDEVKALESTIAQLKKKIADLKAVIENCKKQLAESQKNIDDATKIIAQNQTEYEKEQDTIKKLQDKQENKAKEYESAEQQLKSDQNALQTTTIKMESAADDFEKDMINQQEEYKRQIQRQYNPEEDGDLADYMARKMQEFSLDTSASSNLQTLQSTSNTLQSQIKSGSNELKDIATNLSSIAKNINASIINATQIGNDITTAQNSITADKSNLVNLQGNIDSATAEVASLEPQVAQQEALLSDAKYVSGQNYGKISEAEWKVVQDNNIDLTERMPNGEPRYIIAAGMQDKKWHIYDMSANGASIVRQKAQGQGFDIIENGNGYMYNYQEKSAGDGKIVYSISSDQSQLDQANACYTTSSPLAFDLEGDGIKTGVIITYDIDGDGELDNINDVSDAILVFDSNNDGISGKDGTEVFGNNTDIDGDGIKENYKDGFAALKALAKSLGLIGGDDNTLDANDLKRLEEEKGLKIKTDGYNSQAQSLADIGISEINLAANDSTVMNDNFDGNGNQLMTQEGATFKINGETRTYADVWHEKHHAGANFKKEVGAKAAKLPDLIEDNYENNAQKTINDANKAVLNNKRVKDEVQELLDKYLK